MGFSKCTTLLFVFIILRYYLLKCSVATDTITFSSSQFIKDPETLSSIGGKFTLGFFSSLENSTYRYVGIWWQPDFTVLWVANRNQPISDSSGIVTVSEDGNLVVLDGQKQVLWSSNVSNISSSNSSFQLSDYGSLILLENTTGDTIWESFQHPTNTIMPNMKLRSSKRTVENVKLTSWKTHTDPSPGKFSFSIERLSIPEVFIWNGNHPCWRSGPWNGKAFTGLPMMKKFSLTGIHVGDDGQGNVEYFYTKTEEVGFIIHVMRSLGTYEQKSWNEEKQEWQVTWTSYESECDVYGVCGPFATCNSQSLPICSCLRGFEPKNTEEWNKKNWTSGCIRRIPLQCERGNNKITSADNKKDGFLKLQMIKVPDFADGSSLTLKPDACRSRCLDNCSCVAYSYDADIGCMSWTGNLIDIQQFSFGGLDIYIRVAHTELDKERKMTVIITITVTTGIVLITTFTYIMWRRISNHHAKKSNNKGFLQFYGGGARIENTSENVIGELSQIELQELLIFSFEKLVIATNNFHPSNRLGQGGFGPVYKGKLQDGQEIAVKRLSWASLQGLEEFMNEVAVISKLQHRNLVRLLGCCVEAEEKMLIYEYMPNKSLDTFVFDLSENKFLDWRKRLSIIEGVARGLLYLHRDSRLKIIHRDLKASNILLDEELNPKISDFGMARIFGGSEDQANTRRVVGTYGYMSPEYAMQGVFSEKSDVFSFGVLLLEIVTGRRSSCFYDSEDSLTLLGFAWIQWTKNNISSLIGPRLYDPSLHKYIFRCIHIGLLCVQEFSTDRPTMATLISMLNSEIVDLPSPKKPAFVPRQNMLSSMSFKKSNGLYSLNSVSISDIQGR